jgi:hypothetical protein
MIDISTRDFRIGFMREVRKVYRVGGKARKERAHTEDRAIDARMGSEWILGTVAGECGVYSTGSG